MAGDRRMADRDQCVLRYLLDRHAAGTPQRPYCVFADGSFLAYGELREAVRSTARALQDLGVRQGDPVLVWLPNGGECLRVWFAINYIGAVYVPMNVALRGGVLAHVIANSGARLAVVHSELAPRLRQVDRAGLATVVILGPGMPPVPGLDLLDAAALDARGAAPLPLERDIEPWDTQSIIYTSGTTGPSKGVLCSYFQLYTSGKALHWLTEEDRYMVTLPMFHVGGTLSCYSMLALGGSVSMIDGFETASFWQTVRRTGTSCATLLGVMANFLAQAAPRPDDADNPLRTVTIVPFDENGLDFGRRFGVEVYTLFHMTEVSCPIMSRPNPSVVGSAGKPRPGVEARIVDEHDCEVPPGATGELVLRTDAPWAMNHGYNDAPEATAQAWRNGWFHTGDLFRVDDEGEYFFVDRRKDSIRRRGENVSSFEVENEVRAFPGVREAAAVAVPSEASEDEILVALSLQPGAAFDPAGFIEFLRPRMAHFMIPRYVRVMDDLPKTPSQKVLKYAIREQGVTADTWDRDKAGIVVRRERLR